MFQDLKIHYSKQLEEQTFDMRFFSLVRILGNYVLSGETSTGTPVSPDNIQNI